MAYREVGMLEVKEVLRLWLAGQAKKAIARQVGLDPKTVRSYVAAALAAGLIATATEVSDELLAKTLAELRADGGRPRGEAWAICEREREEIARLLGQGVRLSKARKLLQRRGVEVPYSTLHRFAVEELEFGRTAPTVPVVDGKPGEELEVDTGWVVTLAPNAQGKRRRMRAWIFTPNVSRYRFVWPTEQETTAEAIAACEAAWEFYGGIFSVLKPDNTKAIVTTADPINPRITRAFLEYSQQRGFHVDPARVRSPQDKGRVERSVQTVRDDCFGGEELRTIVEARERALRWCEHEYGVRRHSTTRRMPKEHFEAEEKPALLPAPLEDYDVPQWCEPKVGRDHLAQVAKALYSLPTRLIGKTLRARADRSLVLFYDGDEVVKTHARQPVGGRSVDPEDFPSEKRAYALRDVDYLARQAKTHGEHVGHFAQALLEGPLPWTRMRRVYALLALAKRYGDARLDAACATALKADMLDVHRLKRMLERAAPAPKTEPAQVIPLARYLRPASQYALPLASSVRENIEGEEG
jgi:transposase